MVTSTPSWQLLNTTAYSPGLSMVTVLVAPPGGTSLSRSTGRAYSLVSTQKLLPPPGSASAYSVSLLIIGNCAPEMSTKPMRLESTVVRRASGRSLHAARLMESVALPPLEKPNCSNRMIGRGSDTTGVVLISAWAAATSTRTAVVTATATPTELCIDPVRDNQSMTSCNPADQPVRSGLTFFSRDLAMDKKGLIDEHGVF
jgi:hypothetical protein